MYCGGCLYIGPVFSFVEFSFFSFLILTSCYTAGIRSCLVGAALLNLLSSSRLVPCPPKLVEAAGLLNTSTSSPSRPPAGPTAVSLALSLHPQPLPVTLGQDHTSWPPTQQCPLQLKEPRNPLGSTNSLIAFAAPWLSWGRKHEPSTPMNQQQSRPLPMPSVPPSPN